MQDPIYSMRVILVVLLYPLCVHSTYVPGTPGAPWSNEEVLAIKAKLRQGYQMSPSQLMRETLIALGESTDLLQNDTAYRAETNPDPPKVLRLAFHDCLKYTDGSGGCDGCLDWAGMDTNFVNVTEGIYDDVKETNNNALRPTVEMLEALFTVPDFLEHSPVMSPSLMESGKSRADLWALAAIVAVEYGIETNNMKCDDSASVMNQCHHKQNEPGCRVELESPFIFRTGRSDCVTTAQKPYMSDKREVHPNSMGNGRETVQFFQDEFNLNSQETVALMGAHSFGEMHVKNSLFRYGWKAKGGDMFNNDYYKMITDEERWFFNDDACTKVGDAYNNKPVRRWLTHIRGDTHNNGPVQWLSESYVCPNCVKEPEDECCQDVPDGLFCTPDSVGLPDKTPEELNDKNMCEKFRFVTGLDETALNCEMGLYFEFGTDYNGYPTGCPGFDVTPFDGNSSSYDEMWSNVPSGVKADPQCPKQMLSVPESAQPTHWYMETYAREQELWFRDFESVLDKMMMNGYPEGESWPVVDQWTGVSCSPRGADYSQCWHECTFSDQEVFIESQLDQRVIQVNESTGSIEIWERVEGNPMQHWKWCSNTEGHQLAVNVGSNMALEVSGIGAWIQGEQDTDGYFTLVASGGMEWQENDGLEGELALTRGWDEVDGRKMSIYAYNGTPPQRFKLTLV